jgi:hypothetical protein
MGGAPWTRPQSASKLPRDYMYTSLIEVTRRLTTITTANNKCHTIFSHQNAPFALSVHSTSLEQAEVAIPLRNERSHLDDMRIAQHLLYFPSI